MSGATETIQAEWSFDFAAACQRFAGASLTPQPDQFILATEALADHVPLWLSPPDRLAVRDRLIIATQKSAQQYHVVFHHCVRAPCRSSPLIHSVALAWDDLDDDPRLMLVQWANRFLDEFNRSHTWPSPIRVAQIIHGCFQAPLEVRAIAREVGCSRSALIRAFGRAFGMSMHEYQARCRIREAIKLLRQAGSKVRAVAHDVGYRSPKNFYRALSDLTGLTPSTVREMVDSDIAELLGSGLPLPQAFQCWSA